MKKFDNYASNLAVLMNAGTVLMNVKDESMINEFVLTGVIGKFGLQFELGWKLLKELLRYEGLSVSDSGSPREILKAAYTVYGFMNEEIWLSMLKSRNEASHIYDGGEARALADKIIADYIPEFVKHRGVEHRDGLKR